jgi:hypothetical protein
LSLERITAARGLGAVVSRATLDRAKESVVSSPGHLNVTIDNSGTIKWSGALELERSIMMRALVSIAGCVVVASVVALAQSATYARGESVRVKASVSSNQARPTMDLRIVGVPGDRLRTDQARLFVNDVAVVGFSVDFLGRVAQRPEWVPSVLPPGHYFVMGERRVNQDISEYWGMHSEVSLEPAP